MPDQTQYTLDHILDMHERQVVSNNLLVGVLRQVLHQNSCQKSKNNDLLSLCLEIYQGLTDKQDLSIVEIGWHQTLHQLLIKHSIRTSDNKPTTPGQTHT